MPEGGANAILVPYTEFEPVDLARQLHGLVDANVTPLTLRGLRGVISRYDDLDAAKRNVLQGQAEHHRLGRFAIVNEEGNVRGVASLHPDFPLRKLRLPIPPALARGPLTTTYPFAAPNVHAWTGHILNWRGRNEDFGALLAPAYKELVRMATPEQSDTTTPRPWTAKPVRSPEFVHEAIVEAGLAKVATRRFDNGESRRRVPPRSTVYAKLQSNGISAYEKQEELRTGQNNAAYQDSGGAGGYSRLYSGVRRTNKYY